MPRKVAKWWGEGVGNLRVFWWEMWVEGGVLGIGYWVMEEAGDCLGAGGERG